MWLRPRFESSDFPRRVLVVEPSSSERTRLCNILTEGAMEVYPARDLITALHACSLFQPDLILCRCVCPLTVVLPSSTVCERTTRCVWSP